MENFNVIYMDPPWNQKAGRPFTGKYKKENNVQIFDFESNKSNALKYDTMTLNEIRNIDIQSIAADNCHLYIWVTNKYLKDVFELIKHWGFTYSTTIIWCKNPIGSGLGGTYTVSSEFLIFAKKGKLKSKNKVVGNWFNVKRKYINGKPCHSKKPDFFRQLIEKVSPGLKVELFAREKHEGWYCWGNEIQSDIVF